MDDDAKAGPAAKSGTDVELAFWGSAEKAGTLAAFQAYLDAYPAGAFAPLARARMADLANAGPGNAKETSAANDSKESAKGDADEKAGDRRDDVVASVPKERQIFRREKPVHIGDQRVKSWVAQRPVGRCYNISIGAATNAAEFRVSFEPFSADRAVVTLAGKRQNFSQPKRAGKHPRNYWGQRQQFVSRCRAPSGPMID